jgi:zinc protease
VTTYLGSLPAAGQMDAWRDPNVNAPPGVVRKTIAGGIDPRSRVSLVFHGDAAWSRANAYDIAFLADVLRIRLRETLREDLGAVYHVDVRGTLSREPREEYLVDVRFTCAPGYADTLVAAVLAETDRLAKDPTSDDYLRRAGEIRRRDEQTEVSEEKYWLRQLASAYAHGEDPRMLAPDHGPKVGKMTPERLRAAAKSYLDPRQYLVGISKPR